MFKPYPSCIYLSPIVSSLTESFLLCKFHFFSFFSLFFVIFFTYYSNFIIENFICPFILNGTLTFNLKVIYTSLYHQFALLLQRNKKTEKSAKICTFFEKSLKKFFYFFYYFASISFISEFLVIKSYACSNPINSDLIFSANSNKLTTFIAAPLIPVVFAILLNFSSN